ncbi:hypothetical protein OC861_003321 [Tilletia horrida]|nr:hypothetical protein OC861_003321 [Tilletia horrida]
MLAEAGVIVSPVHVSNRPERVQRIKNKKKKYITQDLLANLERSEAAAQTRSAVETGFTKPPSALADIKFPILFRKCRSKLWVPTAAEAKLPADTDMQAWLQSQLNDFSQELSSDPERLAAFEALSPQEQIDLVLLPTWQSLSDAEQNEAFIRARFQCARKLGWRRGYSAGFPTFSSVQQSTGENSAQASDADDANLRAELSIPEVDEATLATVEALLKRIRTGSDKADQLLAQRELFQLDEERAWKSWVSLPDSVRVAEEREAWQNRDRSRIFIDDTPGSSVCLYKLARWFETPQRAGPLNFLPNTIVRLVRNHTPPGTDYDVWKATFRVPLSMHKHALRSYLLAIYGLQTTWARSMIYRSKLIRSVRSGGSLRPGKDRTFKKVEVGLLEPFLWPGVAPEFLSSRMMVHEMKFESARAYMKMTRTARWRARRAADPQYDAVKEAVQSGLLPPSSASAPAYLKTQVSTKSGGIPTAKHNRILSLLLQKKLSRDAEIRQIMQERATAPSSSSSSP